jgi:hypothetical protein
MILVFTRTRRDRSYELPPIAWNRITITIRHLMEGSRSGFPPASRSAS